METTEKTEALYQERSELRRMIGEGITFDIDVKYKRRKRGFFGLFQKREEVTEKRVFKIAEPTLSTLDRLSVMWLDIAIDETKLNSDDYLSTAKQLAAKEAERLAEVVAMAVLGEDYYDVSERGGMFVWKENKERLAELKNLFFHTISPSELLTIAIYITNVSNLGDFTNAIRLTSAARTSEPTNLIDNED